MVFTLLVGGTATVTLDGTVTGTTTGAGVFDEAGRADETTATDISDETTTAGRADETLATELTGETSATGLSGEDPTDQFEEVGGLSGGDTPEERGSISNSNGTRRTPLWRRPEALLDAGFMLSVQYSRIN